MFALQKQWQTKLTNNTKQSGKQMPAASTLVVAVVLRECANEMMNR